MTTRLWQRWAAGQAVRPEAAASEHRAKPGPDTGKVFGALIMMVDDEPLALEVAQVYLEDAGFRHFVTTSEPAGALDLLVQRKPDVLLLDLMMPVVSGFDILAGMEARKILKDVPTIVLTSATDHPTKLKALKLGVTEFLTKPVDPIDLVLRVSNTLAAKAYWRGCWEAR